ncbi:MAG TPA: DEAD/DEAH box helicase [Kofleriaceae bacterium]|nr:DEAD/DEAH box helicase [Kofleriaceae bacterium]
MAPTLARMLTLGHLRDRAGGLVFARGESYWRQGRVESCVNEGEVLEGVVVGSERYRVRLTVDPGGAAARCTCPVGESFCKHAVAMGLAYLVKRAAEEPRASGERGFATRAEVEAWAAEHQVKHVLPLVADLLVPRLPAPAQRHGMRHVLARVTLRDVAARDSAARLIGMPALEAPIVEAATQELERAAAIVRAGCEEERARPDRHADPAVAPLWSRLVEARRVVRAHAAPRSRAARASAAWRLDDAASALAWKEPDRMIRGPYDYGTIAIATRLSMPGGGQAWLECSCGAPGARCTHSLALIDATLDRLEDPALAREARALAEELLQPGWSRLLRELDARDESAARPRAAIEVWWHVEYELGTLTLSPVVKKQLKRGPRAAMSPGTRLSVARLLGEHREVMPELDRQIAEHLAAWVPPSRGPGNRATSTYPARAFLALVGHPRVTAEWSEEPIDVVRLPLGFAACAEGEDICLEPALDGSPMSPKALTGMLDVFAPGEPLVVEQPEHRRYVLIDVGDDARQLWGLLQKHGARFPPESHTQLLDRLGRLEARLPLAVPPALKGRQLAGEAVTVARLRLLPDVTLELELLIRPGEGAPLFQPGSGPRDVLLARGGERGYVRRALTSEPAQARAQLVGLPLDGAEEGPPFCYRVGDPEAALRLVAALEAPPPGLAVEWLDARPVIARGVGPEALRVQVERRRDWFGIAGELKIEAGRLELAVLLDAARRQQRFVRTGDAAWIELTDTLRQRLAAIADHSFAGRQDLELSPGAVPALHALAEAGAEVEAAPDWQQLTARLAASARLAPKPPAALTATLRDYQVEGHAWLVRVAAWGAGACLADDMGLGKTIQAIALLLDRARHGPALVIAPTSVAYNWASELARFAPTLSPVVYGDQPDRARCLARLRKKDVVIASYGLLVRDVELLATRPFATLVLDEAQALKNAGTRRARAARRLDAGFRVALSGTPFENHLGELWSLFAIIFPGLLGSWEQFRERFAGPIERAKDPEARAALSSVLRPFLLRRTKQEVARELPSRTEIVVPVALSKEEAALYEDARLAAVAELDRQGKAVRDEQRRFQVLAALTRLRLLASHPRLYDGRSEIASSKLRRLLELIDELRSEGHRALVFSQFTSHLALVKEAFDRAGIAWLYLDGDTPPAERARRIAAFQAGEGDVFLLSLKAGGTGINLTAADYVVHLDPWWNPAVEDQATDRAHRIGQTRPVTVYRLVARGTIEEQILAMHGDKRALVAGVLDGTDVAARLSTQDLLALLASGLGGAAGGAERAEPEEPDERAEPAEPDERAEAAERAEPEERAEPTSAQPAAPRRRDAPAARVSGA